MKCEEVSNLTLFCHKRSEKGTDSLMLHYFIKIFCVNAEGVSR